MTSMSVTMEPSADPWKCTSARLDVARLRVDFVAITEIEDTAMPFHIALLEARNRVVGASPVACARTLRYTLSAAAIQPCDADFRAGAKSWDTRNGG